MNGHIAERFVREGTPSVVPGSRVVRTSEVTCVGGPHSHDRPQPVIELIREGDVVTAIDVTCSCGENPPVVFVRALTADRHVRRVRAKR